MELALKSLEQILGRTAAAEPEMVRTKEIMEELKELRMLLKANDTLFNMAVDSDLVDACIFERNALTARMNYLVRLAKSNGG